MKIGLHFSQENQGPIAAFFVECSSIESAFEKLMKDNLLSASTQIFLVPSKENELRGILVKTDKDNSHPPQFLGIQKLGTSIYIPELSKLFPLPDFQKIENLFPGKHLLFLPNEDIILLSGPFSPAHFLKVSRPKKAELRVLPEAKSSKRNFQRIYLQLESAEESLNRIENLFKKENQPISKPLSILEKIKLLFLRIFFKKENEEIKPTALGKRLLEGKGAGTDWLKSQSPKFDNLTERNKKEIDKLLELLDKDPERGLRHALPLSDNAFGRGLSNAVQPFVLSLRWFSISFNLGGNSNPSYGGGTLNLEQETYNKLLKKYQGLADQFEKNGEYEKAAFVYLKLIKNKYLAASMLEKAGKHLEAGKLYLSIGPGYSLMAANAFRKGGDKQKALTLYIQSKVWEKAGDVLLEVGQSKQAEEMFRKALTELKDSNQLLGAGNLAITKLKDHSLANELFKLGWKKGSKGQACLKAILRYHNLDDQAKILSELIPEALVLKQRQELLIELIQLLQKSGDTAPKLKQQIYSSISLWANDSPEVLSQLKGIDKKNTGIQRDIQRYKRAK